MRSLVRSFVRRRLAIESKQSGTNFYESEDLSDVLSEASMNSSRPEQLTADFSKVGLKFKKTQLHSSNIFWAIYLMLSTKVGTNPWGFY